MGKLFEKVSPFTLARPFAVAMALIGLVTGLIYLVGGIISDIFITHVVNLDASFFALLPLRFSVLIIMPLTSAVFGFTVGTISALLNNLVVDLFHKLSS